MAARLLPLLLSAALLAVGVPVHAQVQAYPSRPITIVVPFPPGGPVDATTRMVTERMKDKLGQPFIVENLGGAAGSIAAGKVAKSKADGYTLLTGIWSTQVANAAIYKLPYDVEKDFEPIVLVSSNPLLIVARGDAPAADLKGLVGWLKANPGKASQGTSGVGSVGHVAGLLFQKETGTQFQFVPYRGLAPAMQDLMAGTIDLMFDTPATSLPQLKTGRIKAYAVTAGSRLASAPNIPTVDEAGFPSLHAYTWTAFFAPKGTPRDVVQKLTAAAMEALADPGLKARLSDIGQEVYPREQQPAAALAALQRSDMEKWLPIIRAANITAEPGN
jgi:tripartite-type tricarboxylate transporter receptor subunit TctC